MFLKNYEIKKSSKRKTVSIKFTKDKIVIYAPSDFSDKIISKIIEQNRSKIEEKYRIWEKRQVKRTFKNGDSIYFFGKQYPIENKENTDISLYFDEKKFLISSTSLENSKKLFENFFKRMASEYICKRVKELALKYGFNYEKCKITKAKTRWGSCSYKNSLNFSLYLIMAPPEVIDYVILHELVHTVHKNHSENFWNMVKSFVPEYKKHRIWLRKNVFLMRF